MRAVVNGNVVMTVVKVIGIRAGLKGGPGGHVPPPPPPEEAVSALKKYNIFHALYEIASIYTVMHT